MSKMTEPLKSAAKTLRVWPPLNNAATAGARQLLQRSGRQSEWLISHLPRAGITQERLPNGRVFRLWSRGDDWVSNQVFWRGWRGYEAETSSLFYRLATQAATVFDIGAHVGFFTILAAHANPRARVFAFEPMPPVRARLQNNLRLNRLKNVICRAEKQSEKSKKRVISTRVRHERNGEILLLRIKNFSASLEMARFLDFSDCF